MMTQTEVYPCSDVGISYVEDADPSKWGTWAGDCYGTVWLDPADIDLGYVFRSDDFRHFALMV